MNDLGPKELEFLSALRANDEPALADRERLRRRVWLAVGLSAVGTSGVGIGTQTAVAATPKLGLLAATTAKVGLVVGLAAGGVVFATHPWSSTKSVSAPPAAVAREVAKSEQGAIASEPSVNLYVVSELLVVPQVAKVPVAGSHSRSKAEPPANAASAGADLDAEIGLLRQARQAMQAGEFTRALESLNEHARRFPRGVLASERQASVAMALCRSGQMSTGKARAERYLDRNPTSPLADRVRASCKLD